MQSSQPPIFRKSMHGYNKEDVNAYISNMSRMFLEKEKEYRTGLASCNAKLQEDEKAIQALEEKLNAAAAEAAECGILREKLADLQAQLEEIKAAGQKRTDLSSDDPCSIIRSLAAWDPVEGEISEEISMRAGKVMLAAQSAAESIIQKAQNEADTIVRGAKNRREEIFHDISATADTVITDIRTYMKMAVDKCFGEIYGDLGEKENDGHTR